MKGKIVFWLSTLLLVASFAAARVEFGVTSFDASDFQNPERLDELCSGGADAFWCDHRDDQLSLITTKSIDVLFDPAGEIVAMFAKQQRGQDFNGRYNLNNNQNLIPYDASLPSGAVLIDESYLTPQEVTSDWRRSSETELIGTFSYRLSGEQGDFAVTKELTVSALNNTIDIVLDVRRIGELAADAAPVAVRYAVPGIGRQDTPTVRLGQGSSHTENPLEQPVTNPTYVSIHNRERSTGFAMILRPQGGEPAGDELIALSLADRPVITMGKVLPPTADASLTLNLDYYGGPNELVRYFQEGYLDLPGLFSPNLLGRLSLGILALLQGIHGVLGNWGLSIIALTLLFRILIWPLITVQTKSMVGMQELQPKLQALQKKHKDNKEKLTEETMKLYKEAGVNPAGGCLPILLQMPIFIMLWRVFINFEFNEGFLWIPDLGLADPFYILPILYVGIMVGQSFLMSRGNPQSLRQQLMINVIFVFFIITFPAAVTLYWITSMGVQVGQHYLIQRTSGAKPATA